MTSEALTAERCAIVLDSTSDLPDCRERHANMRMVPLTVRFGDEELLDYEEISPQRFYERLAGDPQPPRTAAPPPERFAACYRELLEDDGYEHVLSLHLSEALSATVSSARLAAARVRRPRDGRRHPHGLDRRWRWRRSASRGSSRPGPARSPTWSREAEAFHRRSRLVFAFETLEFLQRNGRIGRGQALVGGLLGVRPLLTLVEGEVEPLGARARPRAPAGRARAARLRGHARRTSALRVGIAHAQAESIANDIAETRAQRAPAGRDRARGAARRRRRHEHRPGRRRTRVGARARLSRLKSVFAALKARPRLLAGLQIAAAVVLLAFLGYEFSDAVRDAWPRLRHADLKLVALALVLLAAYYLLFVLGWQSILRAYGIRLGYRAVLGAEMLSMLAKYIPGGVWTPAARVVAARRAGVDNTSVVLATILLEAGLSAVAGVIVLAASLPFVSGVDAPVWPVVAFAVLATGLLHPRVFAPLATRLCAPLRRRRDRAAAVGHGDRRAALLLRHLAGGRRGPDGAARRGRRASRHRRDRRTSAAPAPSGAIVAVVTVIFPSGLGVREGAVGAFMLALAPESAVVGAVVLNRLAITIVEALLLAVAAGLSRGRRHSYPARGMTFAVPARERPKPRTRA